MVCSYRSIALTGKKCDRPQLPNRFNIRKIVPPRDRLDDATISQTTGLSIEDVQNLRSP
ncbi:hypothetical protein [Tychonema sp. LEGE 06208]|uniref:hypothetical protein n=1 Tax=Tychonema sp. LEGE 06208 TaxID=1828663 RepID=UPI001881C3C4|nr:hypothetical protein [Tychonema sp. LEGE 06208]MBE9164326.1 hypothetical protein [Tychonema sp. LEGE 06208]